MDWATFSQKYLHREDGHKYEWVEGSVVKTKSMDYTQLFIVKNLLAFFRKLMAEQGITGELIPESDVFFGGNHRRPDIAYFTDEQIAAMSYGENQVPKFVIEIISTKDQVNLIQQKMNNYRQANVQVVWQIFPLSEQVHVYGGSMLKSMSMCERGDLCSAVSVLTGFEMTAAEVFKKAPRPEKG